MASAIMRRNSNKQGLQNLLRVTAQRSMEDAEEIERERRRRARESIRQRNSQIGTEEASLDGGSPADDSPYESKVKPSCQSALEEDEGFSDWTQKLERHRQQRLEEQNAAEEDERRGTSGTATVTEGWQQRRPHWGEDEDLGRRESESSRRRKEQDEEEQRQEELRRQREREREEEERQIVRKQEEEQRSIEEKPNEKRKEMKISYTSKVFLQQETRHVHTNGDTASVEETPLMKTKRSPRSLAQEHDDEAEVFLETEQKLEKIRRSHQEKESQELEQLRQRQAESEAELEELKKRREERRRIREEEERKREAEEHQRHMKEEEERKQMKEDIERRRMQAAERRMKTLSVSSNEGDEPFCPLSPKSPTFKNESEERVAAENTYSITERTESLNRSLKKSNSIKKTQPPVLVTKIDDRLEQYSHAIETSTKESKGGKQVLMDIPSPPEPVASKKNLFEAGEAWSQNAFKGTPSKDAEGLKVGVATLINQWVKGNVESGNKGAPAKSTDVKAGDVLHKKNMWETIGDTSSTGKWTPGSKGTPSGKRYKFIVTGHGKYEKIPVSDDNHSEYTNGKSANIYHGDS
ncbi:non-muscle caldesmon isoform X1 [Scleropages formosus]|uniref:Non-muscle caldesmon-like n=1 Tax=Scleropages formosus TaxID=113540 RepID=A0A8C9QPY9_SCLFO|nr:non-muscle caldesmon-like isoform X1 [Scleropages formosus]